MLAGLFIRRFVIKPKGLEIVRDDYIVLPLLFAILITGFLIEGARMAATELQQNPELARFSPGGLVVGQIASMIAAYAKDKGFDLIFTGMQSQDRGSAQVGVTVAEQLGFACTTTIVDFDYDNGIITAKRELEGGIKGVVRLKTPALVTCQLGLNIPRYPTLPNIMKAKKKEILAIPVTDLLKEEPLATTTSFHPPAKKGGRIVLEGDVGELVEKVIAILKDKTAVLR
jgi:electron transfer flavoprotein beta subunit